MRFAIRHVTTYRYDGPVYLGRHVLRLRPRADGGQRLTRFNCAVTPVPTIATDVLDLEGNVVTHLWFQGQTRELRIATELELETLRANAFDWVPDVPAATLPFEYPGYQRAQLEPYRGDPGGAGEVATLAHQLASEAELDPVRFLVLATDFLHANVAREIREQGDALPAGVTLRERTGSCRDIAVLLMALARAQGFATRFVSGYQDKSEHAGPRRYMHAWPEVYLPAGGWRGFDPTRGIAVADAHVALASAREPRFATPVEGFFSGPGVSSTLQVELEIAAG